MNFARFCLTLATFPARYAVHRINRALGAEDLALRVQAATMRASVQADEADARG